MLLHDISSMITVLYDKAPLFTYPLCQRYLICLNFLFLQCCNEYFCKWVSILLWIYLYSKFAFTELLDQEGRTSNFNRYCQIILSKVDHEHFRQQVFESGRCPAAWPILGVDQPFHFYLSAHWELISHRRSTIMSEVNHSGFFPINSMFISFPDFHVELFSLDWEECSVNGRNGIVFCVILGFFCLLTLLF